jgi:hypothetical protein
MQIFSSTARRLLPDTLPVSPPGYHCQTLQTLPFFLKHSTPSSYPIPQFCISTYIFLFFIVSVSLNDQCKLFLGLLLSPLQDVVQSVQLVLAHPT